MTSKDKGEASFEAFWPWYVQLHSRKITRYLHACATASLALWVVAAFVWRQPLMLLAAPLSDYLIAQASHRLFEHNVTKPWRHPTMHARAQLKLFLYTVTGRMDAEVARYAK